MDRDITNVQLDTLVMIAKKPIFWEHHPKYRFKLNVLDALERKGLIEYYDGKEFPKDAVRITEKGKNQLIKELISNGV